MRGKQIIYKPIKFIAITFAVTWICAFLRPINYGFSHDTVLGSILLISVDFFESASPLLAALILLRQSFRRKGGLVRYFFGHRPQALPYVTVLLLFAIQFLTFYLFGTSNGPISLTTFLGVWGGQILFGGGMEEGGWRGYLQPAFEKKMPIIVSVIMVALVWALWHLPYFFLPNTFHTGGNFPMYMITATATAFTLTAIYKLTGSVLVCTLFHGWQNAIVMCIPPNLGHPGFLTLFVLQTVISMTLCVKPLGLSSRDSFLRRRK